ncbi:hypothetical protein Cal6303_3920 [Calothrix sp. PCC 6303]|nr:hypothetical protein Cal6303_3920 [Calothrix sp. PCC 6303]
MACKMKKSTLPPDDMPPAKITQQDRIIQVELERSIGRCVLESCDQITQALLTNCQWYITTNASTVKIVIDCPDIISYWHIVSNIPQIGKQLEKFSGDAKIRVYPPTGKGMPFEISVNEITAYRDWL